MTLESLFRDALQLIRRVDSLHAALHKETQHRQRAEVKLIARIENLERQITSTDTMHSAVERGAPFDEPIPNELDEFEGSAINRPGGQG